MSHDLERLLNALWERETCEPKDLFRWQSTVELLLADARSQMPGLSREQFLEALAPRYREFRRARRKPAALPPQA